MTKCYCDNCTWEGDQAELRTPLDLTPDLNVRLEPGSVVPAGECPRCRCFCYLETKNPAVVLVGNPVDGIWVEADEAPVTAGEHSLFAWQYGKVDGFEKKLWEAIDKADSTNLGKLELGFPEHVEAYRRYSYERGYWVALIARIRKLEGRQ